MFAGIDWALDNHAVCVVDDAGGRISSFGIEHSRSGFDELVSRLRQFGDPKNLPIAIERPDGRLVDRLLEAGHPVICVKPNAIKAWREAEVLSGAKSDPGDAHVIAEYLRLCFHRLKSLDPFSDATRALRAAVRGREDLVDQRTAACNQLQATLEAFWPGANALFGSISSQIALAFLRRYPTPASARKLGEKEMADLSQEAPLFRKAKGRRACRETSQCAFRDHLRRRDGGPQGSGLGVCFADRNPEQGDQRS